MSRTLLSGMRRHGLVDLQGAAHLPAASTMGIVIPGFASEPDTEAHNMILGTQRAEPAKGYLVSQAVDPSLIDMATRGVGRRSRCVMRVATWW